ncbi:histidine kinase [Kribbella sp. NPDC056861]|uniref:sensor histidine kinase n=1 Tax=Kribbella sp. NPDC056861 TaxID=3154857 RepID=UPI00342B79BB
MTDRGADEFSARHWPDWTFLGSQHSSIHRTRLIAIAATGAALAALTAQTVVFVADRYTGLYAVLAIGLVAGYALVCLLTLWFGPLSSRRTRVRLVTVTFLVGAAPAVLLNSPVLLSNLTFAVAITLMLLPLRVSLPLSLAVAAGQVGWMLTSTGSVDWRAVFSLVGVTIALGIVFALAFTIGQLRAAREQVRQLAVDQERERFARDLHDILGHSLSTITVKLGAARRHLEVAPDVDAAVVELRELEALSRQALSDVRDTVSDQRAVSLVAELAGARLALRAAGVRADLPAAVDDVRPELQGVFGYVVREAVTNILRHSNAGRCSIRIGLDWVEIRDDGAEIAAGYGLIGLAGDGPVGPAGHGAVQPTKSSAGGHIGPSGHGLIGLAERLAAVGGSLEHGRAADGGFRILAQGPGRAVSAL